MSKVTILTEVLNFGHMVVGFDIPWDQGEVDEKDLALEGNYLDLRAKTTAKGITAASVKDGVLHIDVDPFLYAADFTLTVKGNKITKETADDRKIAVVDDFTKHEKYGVLYRLYTPKAKEARPLVLFLHGGGEQGFDNEKQMLGTIGAAKIAERYPDVYVLAPQAPSMPGGFDPSKLPKMERQTFATSDFKGETGWHRKYLASVCDIIREMIADGKVNPKRVYVTGMSMGGGGTLRALSVGNDLFAAAVPICPTMTPETYGILCGLTDMKIWIATAYVDHTIYRHKYIVDGIMKIKDAGNKNARLTLYSPEDLEKYGIATDPDLPLAAKFGANHASWILVMNNEEGILDWLLAQTRD